MNMYTGNLKYVRIQERNSENRTDTPAGIFTAVWRLEQDGLITDEEKAVFHEIAFIWFEDNLPKPPIYDDNRTEKLIAWFKTATAGKMLEKLQPLINILDKYKNPYEIVYTNFPGKIIYEDEWQVVVYNDSAFAV